MSKPPVTSEEQEAIFLTKIKTVKDILNYTEIMIELNRVTAVLARTETRLTLSEDEYSHADVKKIHDIDYEWAKIWSEMELIRF